MTLAKRLLVGSLVLVGVLVAGIVAIAGNRLQTRLLDETSSEPRARGAAGRVRVASRHLNADSLADAAGAALHRRVTLIDSTGVVVGDSEFDGEGLANLQNHSTRPEVIDAQGERRRPIAAGQPVGRRR